MPFTGYICLVFQSDGCKSKGADESMFEPAWYH